MAIFTHLHVGWKRSPPIGRLRDERVGEWISLNDEWWWLVRVRCKWGMNVCLIWRSESADSWSHMSFKLISLCLPPSSCFWSFFLFHSHTLFHRFLIWFRFKMQKHDWAWASEFRYLLLEEQKLISISSHMCVHVKHFMVDKFLIFLPSSDAGRKVAFACMCTKRQKPKPTTLTILFFSLFLSCNFLANWSRTLWSVFSFSRSLYDCDSGLSVMTLSRFKFEPRLRDVRVATQTWPRTDGDDAVTLSTRAYMTL